MLRTHAYCTQTYLGNLFYKNLMQEFFPDYLNSVKGVGTTHCGIKRKIIFEVVGGDPLYPQSSKPNIL